ncbi:MAG: hypothetical protein CMJ46_01375 [Planctomyces sp.]|nr:hypothetical protein [Planctomyces sp.]
MIPAKDVTAILVNLKIADDQALFVILGADGTVNRKGTGAEDNDEHDLFIGKSSSKMFAALKKQIKPGVAKWNGVYKARAPKGKPCLLTVGFRDASGKESICKFSYGSDSQGPPPEICDLVIAAVEITDPWYEKQKKMAGK